MLDRNWPGGMTAVFVTEAGAVYYSPVLSGGLYAKFEPVSSGWTEPDYKLVAEGGNPIPSGVGFIPSNQINEIQMNTFSGTNHIFLATTSGLFIYEEDRNNIKLVVAKHRNGPTGDIDLFFKSEFTKFYEVEGGS